MARRISVKLVESVEDLRKLRWASGTKLADALRQLESKEVGSWVEFLGTNSVMDPKSLRVKTYSEVRFRVEKISDNKYKTSVWIDGKLKSEGPNSLDDAAGRIINWLPSHFSLRQIVKSWQGERRRGRKATASSTAEASTVSAKLALSEEDPKRIIDRILEVTEKLEQVTDEVERVRLRERLRLLRERLGK